MLAGICIFSKNMKCTIWVLIIPRFYNHWFEQCYNSGFDICYSNIKMLTSCQTPPCLIISFNSIILKYFHNSVMTQKFTRYFYKFHTFVFLLLVLVEKKWQTVIMVIPSKGSLFTEPNILFNLKWIQNNKSWETIQLL